MPIHHEEIVAKEFDFALAASVTPVQTTGRLPSLADLRDPLLRQCVSLSCCMWHLLQTDGMELNRWTKRWA